MKSYLFILIFVVVSICSCKKDDTTAQQTATTTQPYQVYYTYLDTSLVHYKFKQGSYWVYKNDSTAALDSIVVDSVSSGFNQYDASYGPGPQWARYAECYEIRMHSFTTLQYFHDDLVFNGIYRNAGDAQGNFPGGQLIYMINTDTETVAEGLAIIAKFPSMIINGNNFNNVDESKITAALQNEQVFANNAYLFYTPNFGLIKKEIDLGGGNIQSWSILRWHLIR